MTRVVVVGERSVRGESVLGRTTSDLERRMVSAEGRMGLGVDGWFSMSGAK